MGGDGSGRLIDDREANEVSESIAPLLIPCQASTDDFGDNACCVEGLLGPDKCVLDCVAVRELELDGFKIELCREGDADRRMPMKLHFLEGVFVTFAGADISINAVEGLG